MNKGMTIRWKKLIHDHCLCIIGMLLLLSVFSCSFPVGASANEVAWSVKAVLPENQLTDGVTYFDLLMNANDQQVVTIVAANTSDEDVTISLIADSARTTAAGLIDYTNRMDEREADESQTFDLKKQVLFEPEYVIPKQSSIEIPITVTMPETAFEGVIAGGLRVTETQPEEAENSQDSNMGIIAYEIPILMRQQEEPLEEQLKCLGTAITDDQVQLQLQNPQAEFIMNASVKTTIKNEDGEIVVEPYTKVIQIAPNTNFAYNVCAVSELPEGKYQLEAVITSSSNDWTFTEPLTVTRTEEEQAVYEQQQEVMKAEQPKQQTTSPDTIRVLAFITAGILFFVIVLTGIACWKLRQTAKQMKQRRLMRQRALRRQRLYHLQPSSQKPRNRH